MIFKRTEESRKSDSKSPHPELKSYLTEILTEAHHQRLHADSRKFLSLFYQQTYTLFDYLPKHAPLFLDDYHKIMDQEARFDVEVANLLTEDLQKSRSFAEAQYFADNSALLRTYKPASYFSNFQKGLGNLRFDALYSFNQYPMQEFFSQFSLLKDEIDRFRKQDYTVILQVTSKQGLHQLQEHLRDYGIDLDYLAPDQLHPGQSQLVIGGLARGFHFVDEKIVLITETEIFPKKG